MDFIDEVRTRSRRFRDRIDHLETEEATKNSLVMPFLQMLGYSIFDPTEVVPEFTADFGSRRGEKVDYALMQNGEPVVLIEAKKHGDNLNVERESQLFRYFSATSARFGILTDGIVYRFYSDLDEARKMDDKPFFVFNMLGFTDVHVEQLKQFHKDSFDANETVEAAREFKYTNEMIRALDEEMRNPSEEFVRFILARMQFPGPKTKQRLAQFTPLVRQAFAQFVKDLIDSRLKSALERGNEQTDVTTEEKEQPQPNIPVAIDYPLHLFLNSKGVQAKARQDSENSFVVLGGSQVVKGEVPSLSRTIGELRKELLVNGALIDEGGSCLLTRDQTFSSPSGAASFVTAAGSSGNVYWKDSEGRRLGDIVRGH